MSDRHTLTTTERALLRAISSGNVWFFTAKSKTEDELGQKRAAVRLVGLDLATSRLSSIGETSEKVHIQITPEGVRWLASEEQGGAP